MPLFTDQTGRTIAVVQSPSRIISLVPSQTELLYHLGLNKEVRGITKFCVHPHSWFRSKTRIGGTKNIKIDSIRSLNPDLILANKEENVQGQVSALWDEFPTWISDVASLETACHMIEQVGLMTGKAEKAKGLSLQIQNGFDGLSVPQEKIKIAYLIWREPYMTLGGDTFIHQMLQYAGFENVFGKLMRYPVVTLEDLQQAGCAALFLSSEPYPFQEKHMAELASQLPGIALFLVDGEMFSWYGSRLLLSPDYFRKLKRQVAIGLGKLQ